MFEPASLTAFKRQLDSSVATWMRDGVYVQSNPAEVKAWREYWDIVRAHRANKVPINKIPKPEAGPANDQLVRGLIRDCAKDLGRPFIWVDVSVASEFNVWEVKIPNARFMEPVVSMLLLGAHPIFPNHKGDLPGSCCYTTPVASNYVFQITDDALFYKWLDRCKNDPVFQKVLGNLPEKVT